ncbi:MAG: YceI family protein [Chloracidobacterium sp.]|nr:YceI family protein [Chloracidobacterium sp.]
MKPETIGAESATTVWIIDPKYATIEFSARMLFFTVKGRLTDFGGKITLDENDIYRSSVEATIKAASVSTGVKMRDEHLRSKDFLNAVEHPEIHFQSASVGRGRDRDMLRVNGALAIKGRNREIALDVTITDRSRSPQGDEILYFAAVADIDRFDFGIEYARGVIRRPLKILIQAQATKRR